MTDNESVFKDLIMSHISERLGEHLRNGDPVLIRTYSDGTADDSDYLPLDPSSIQLDECHMIAWEDITDPTEPKPNRCACSLITLAADGDEPFTILLKGTSLGDLLRDWTGLDYVD